MSVELIAELEKKRAEMETLWAELQRENDQLTRERNQLALERIQLVQLLMEQEKIKHFLGLPNQHLQFE